MSNLSPQINSQFHIFECSSAACRLRFPLHRLHDPQSVIETMGCPLCKATAKRVLTFAPPEAAQDTLTSVQFATQSQLKIDVLLDNVRSIFNVGSMFRTADGAGIRHLHLCGITPTPDHPKLAKTALGAEKSVAWTHHKNGLDAVMQLQDDGRKIWGLEENPDSQPLYDSQPKVNDSFSSLLLIVGNELSGIDPEILRRCDNVYHLPMHGTKRSLNVAVAFGIAIYHINARKLI